MNPLKIWFVNVGHGDCTIIQFPEEPNRIMMIDICNSKSLDKDTEAELLEESGCAVDLMRKLHIYGVRGSMPDRVLAEMRKYENLLDDPIELFKDLFPGESIFRFVLTHPDMDHMTGMHRLFEQEHGINIVNFWDTDNSKDDPEKSGPGYEPKDWETYKMIRNTGSKDPNVLQLYRGAKGQFYTDDGISILSPTKELVDECNEAEDWNNLSQVLCIDYGKSSVLLPGDVGEKAQAEMVSHFGENLKSTILKAPHHGRKSGFYKDFVKLVSPDYTIVSTGKKECDASDSYRRYTKKRVFSTRFMGTIYAELYPDGKVQLFESPKKGQRRIDEMGELVSQLRQALMESRNTRGFGLG